MGDLPLSVPSGHLENDRLRARSALRGLDLSSLIGLSQRLVSYLDTHRSGRQLTSVPCATILSPGVLVGKLALRWSAYMRR